ncbi:MAG: sedoheptulose 7-phosphate cyclase [Pseudomonadota bacterium]
MNPVNQDLDPYRSSFDVRVPEELRYSVDLTHGVLDVRNPLLARYCEGRKAVLFASPTVDALYGPAIRRYFEAHRPEGGWDYVVVPTGEHHKNLRTVETICEHAKRCRMDRNGLLVAFGGGILCDLVGFSASIYKRGIRYIKVNTTLVGQIDVGVGVKTGVNFLASKNMLGTYYPAYASLNDPAFLHTLPLRQLSCGLAEIIKMAIILSRELFELLEEHVDSMLCRRFVASHWREMERDTRVLTLAMQLMIDELRPNLHEKNLERLVDFGHSFSPMIEIESDHRLYHGEAVAIDMALSSRIAVRLGLMREDDCERVLKLLRACDLPCFDEETCRHELLMQSLQEMHLHRGGRINLVVPTGLGSADFIRELQALPAEVVREAVRDLKRHRHRSPAAVPTAAHEEAVHVR